MEGMMMMMMLCAHDSYTAGYVGCLLAYTGTGLQTCVYMYVWQYS